MGWEADSGPLADLLALVRTFESGAGPKPEDVQNLCPFFQELLQRSVNFFSHSVAQSSDTASGTKKRVVNKVGLMALQDRVAELQEIMKNPTAEQVVMQDLKPIKTFRFVLDQGARDSLKKWMGVVARLQYAGVSTVDALDDGTTEEGSSAGPSAEQSLVLHTAGAGVAKKAKKSDPSVLRASLLTNN